MKNPYEELHREFVHAGARVMLSSGQACVMYGIAAFSKDGDWIIEESEESCRAVLSVLEEKKTVEKWPDQARKSDRDAVRLIALGGESQRRDYSYRRRTRPIDSKR